MKYFSTTGTSGGLLYARIRSRFIQETAGDLLRATSLADSAVAQASPEAGARVQAVRELVLACVGRAWLRAHEADPDVLALTSADLDSAATRDGSVAFDRVCSAVLRARFPVETEHPIADRSSRWG